MSKRMVGAFVAAVALVVTIAIPGGATLPGSGFQADDGNLLPQGETDWNSFAPTTWTGTAPTRESTKVSSGWQFKGLEDYQATTADSSFAGGTKQDDDCATVKEQKADNKADLKRIYLASKTAAVNGQNHTFLDLAWIRIPQNTTSPSAHVAFEFNQNGDGSACGGDSDGLVHRSAANGGDMLIVYDFEGGNTDNPTIRLSRWIASGACEIASHSAPCWGVATTLNAAQAEARVNTFGSVDDAIAPAAESLATNEFGEAGIDLTAAGVFTAGTCQTFGKAFGVSRTSGNSGTAQMKDLVGPTDFTLTNCATVNVTKAGSDGGSQAGAVFTLYNGPDTSGSVVGTCTVLADGTCSPSFTDLQPGQYTIDETTLPAGYNKAAGLPFTFTLVAGETKNLAFTNPAAPGTVNISKVDDAGDPVGGILFTLSQGGNVIYSCTTAPSGAGTGTCQIANVTPGTYSVDETVPASSGYIKDATFPKNVVVGNGETKNVSATNPRAFKVIVLVCRQYDGSLYPSGITIDGASAGTSLSSAGATTAGLSESALCGLTAGARSGLRAAPDSSNPHDADIDIPNTQP